MVLHKALLLAGLLTCATQAAGQSELEPPVRIQVAGEPIDVESGHAAPFVWDWDGDGRDDLLVGQYGAGKLRIYRNAGGDEGLQPAVLFRAGEALGTVPSG